MNRPKLREAPLCYVWPVRQGLAYCTMSEGQWDSLLAAAYAVGWVLLELDENEKPIRAYWRERLS